MVDDSLLSPPSVMTALANGRIRSHSVGPSGPLRRSELSGHTREDPDHLSLGIIIGVVPAI